MMLNDAKRSIIVLSMSANKLGFWEFRKAKLLDEKRSRIIFILNCDNGDSVKLKFYIRDYLKLNKCAKWSERYSKSLGRQCLI